MGDISGKNILIFRAYGISVNHFAIEIAIAGQLKQRGGNVSWLVCDGVFEQCDHHWQLINKSDKEAACKICHNAALDRQSYYSLEMSGLTEYLTNEDYESVLNWSESLRDSVLDEACFEGFPVASWCRSSVNTQLRCASIDYSNLIHVAAFKQYLRSTALALLAYRKYLQINPVDYILMMNGRTFATRMVLEIAKLEKIPVAIHEFGRSEETRIMRANENCHSLVGFSRAWDDWRGRALSESEAAQVKQHFHNRVNGRVDYAFNSKNKVPANEFLSRRGPNQKLFSLFTSSTDEIASAEGWGWKFSQLEWIREVVNYFKERLDSYLVIRCHPNHVNQLMGVDKQFIDGLKTISVTSNILIIWPEEPCDTYSLIRLSEAIFAFSSTVALESTLLDKRVYLGGGGLYRGRGIFWESNCELTDVGNEVEKFLVAEDRNCNREVAERFYYFYFFRQVFDVPFIIRGEKGLFCQPEAFTNLAESALISALIDFYCYGNDFFPVVPSESAVEHCLESVSDVLFTVILTTFNRPALLLDALDSISNQTLKRFEVVLVNDHGDPVEPLLANYDFPITYILQPRNQGPAAARNTALRLARGQYVTYLDDDDCFLPDHLQELALAIEANPGRVVYADAVFIIEKVDGTVRTELTREQRYAHDEYSRERLLVDNYIPVNTFACPRSIAVSVGGFDESLSGLEDWDFIMRLAARTPFHHVQRETVQVRMRKTETTNGRRSEHALMDYPRLYSELYSRHSDLGSEAVRSGRRAMLRRFGVSDLSRNNQPASLKDWLEARVLSPVQKRLVKERLEQSGQGPSFGVLLLDLEADRQNVLTTLASLKEPHNLYANIEPVVFTVSDSLVGSFDGGIVNVTKANWIFQLNEYLATASFDWLVLVKAGDEFTSGGFLMAGLELLGAGADFRAIYCDELYRQEDGSLGGAFRPSMNLDYLLSFPAGMAQHWIFRREALVEAGSFDPAFPEALELELILRFVNVGGLAGMGHVDEPLLITSAPALVNVEKEQRAVINHLHERGYQDASIDTSLPGRYLINYGHADKPLVSILISVEDQLPILLRCVTSVMENTRYANYEILLLEHSRASREVREWLVGIESMAEQRIRVLRFPEEAGQDAICNQAAAVAQGEYLVLLSQCCAVISETWLDEMLNHALRPEVGIVGSELINKESTISHAGLVLGLRGPATSPFEGEALSSAGYMQRLQVEQNYSAVSSDCLMISKELWNAIGGLDEAGLSGTLAGVDLCLRAREAGFLTVWSPRVKMMIGSEPKASSVEEADALYAKWLPLLAHDPAYNANFSLVQPGGFKLADTALSWRPLATWRPLPVVLAHPADQFGCGHYRLMQPFKAQQDAGLIDGALSMGLMHVADLERYDPDVILLQRQISEERLEAMRRMKAFSRAFKVYELDDYLPNLPMKSAHKQHMPKDIVKSLRRGLSYVDRFVVSTEALADAFSGFHHDIRVVENKLPPNWWLGLQGQRRTSKRPRVGWAGGAGHTGDLELIADVVKALAGEVDWIFFGMCPEKLRPYVKEFHAGVEISLYPAALARLNLDLALAPLEQNLFNECKSNLRLLEYGACGFPVICSDVGNYRGGLPVTRVKNRFRDWVEAIRMHLADLDTTARQGDELRSAVLRGWMLQDAALTDWRSAWLPSSH
ncbi:glycosyltransferase [Stutzerimonas stutzeri]|uniref:glycosyltransferase n=1 Tax=Stutzerimonas stutzeri TaxID=316 RepID=UPI000307F6F5|nr:glycosyltransferase [Stutzerimonas stutzeri]